MLVKVNKTQFEGFYICKSDTCTYYYDWDKINGVYNLKIYTDFEDCYSTLPYLVQIQILTPKSLLFLKTRLYDLTSEFEEERTARSFR